MKTQTAKCERACPGRCNRCGPLMVMIRLQDRPNMRWAGRTVGWHCLICGKVENLHRLA